MHKPSREQTAKIFLLSLPPESPEAWISVFLPQLFKTQSPVQSPASCLSSWGRSHIWPTRPAVSPIKRVRRRDLLDRVGSANVRLKPPSQAGAHAGQMVHMVFRRAELGCVGIIPGWGTGLVFGGPPNVTIGGGHGPFL